MLSIRSSRSSKLEVLPLVIPEYGDSFTQESAGRALSNALFGGESYVEMGQMRGYLFKPNRNSDLGWDPVNLQNLQDPRVTSLQRALSRCLSEDILGLKSTPSTVFFANGTAANAGAVRSAFETLSERESSGRVIVSSNLAHRSVHQAAFQSVHRVLDVDPTTFQIPADSLDAALDKDVLLLHITLGTTDLGRVEAIPFELLEKAKRLGIWVHLDATYGAFNIGLLPTHPEWTSDQVASLQQLVKHPLIDSIAVDTHKFVGPNSCAALIFPNRDDIPFPDTATYFDNTSMLGGSTLSARPAFLAFDAMQRLGLNGLRLLAVEKLREARTLARYFREEGLATIVEPSSGMVGVQMTSDAESLRVKNILRAVANISCAQISIKGQDYSISGLRFVLSPQKYFHVEPLLAIAKLTRYSLEGARQERTHIDLNEFKEILAADVPCNFPSVSFHRRDEVELAAFYK